MRGKSRTNIFSQDLKRLLGSTQKLALKPVRMLWKGLVAVFGIIQVWGSNLVYKERRDLRWDNVQKKRTPQILSQELTAEIETTTAPTPNWVRGYWGKWILGAVILMLTNVPRFPGMYEEVDLAGNSPKHFYQSCNTWKEWFQCGRSRTEASRKFTSLYFNFKRSVQSPDETIQI